MLQNLHLQFSCFCAICLFLQNIVKTQHDVGILLSNKCFNQGSSLGVDPVYAWMHLHSRDKCIFRLHKNPFFVTLHVLMVFVQRARILSKISSQRHNSTFPVLRTEPVTGSKKIKSQIQTQGTTAVNLQGGTCQSWQLGTWFIQH